MGWFTVAAYLIAAALCGHAMVLAGRYPDQGTGLGLSEWRFWQAMMVIFVCLGINKQLDLQSLFTAIARAAARSEGWYRERRTYQLAFVEALVVCALVGAVALNWTFRHSRPAIKLALLGLMFTLTFVVLRAASFHHIDQFLRTDLAGWRWNWILELSGIAIVGASAAVYRPVRR